MSPGQQANDTHLTVWWHPNPLHYLSRGITNLLAIIQFASCKLPFHSMKKWFPICNICVKRITNVILIFLQTIRHHKREHCVHKITHGMGGRMIQSGGGRGERGRWRHCHCTMLNGIDAAEGTGMFQKDLVPLTLLGWINQYGIQKMFIIYSLPGAFLFSRKKKKKWITLNIFHSTIFLPIKSKAALETP